MELRECEKSKAQTTRMEPPPPRQRRQWAFGNKEATLAELPGVNTPGPDAWPHSHPLDRATHSAGSAKREGLFLKPEGFGSERKLSGEKTTERRNSDGGNRERERGFNLQLSGANEERVRAQLRRQVQGGARKGSVLGGGSEEERRRRRNWQRAQQLVIRTDDGAAIPVEETRGGRKGRGEEKGRGVGNEIEGAQGASVCGTEAAAEANGVITDTENTAEERDGAKADSDGIREDVLPSAGVGSEREGGECEEAEACEKWKMRSPEQEDSFTVVQEMALPDSPSPIHTERRSAANETSVHSARNLEEVLAGSGSKGRASLSGSLSYESEEFEGYDDSSEGELSPEVAGLGNGLAQQDDAESPLRAAHERTPPHIGVEHETDSDVESLVPVLESVESPIVVGRAGSGEGRYGGWSSSRFHSANRDGVAVETENGTGKNNVKGNDNGVTFTSVEDLVQEGGESNGVLEVVDISGEPMAGFGALRAPTSALTRPPNVAVLEELEVEEIEEEPVQERGSRAELNRHESTVEELVVEEICDYVDEETSPASESVSPFVASMQFSAARSGGSGIPRKVRPLSALSSPQRTEPHLRAPLMANSEPTQRLKAGRKETVDASSTPREHLTVGDVGRRRSGVESGRSNGSWNRRDSGGEAAVQRKSGTETERHARRHLQYGQAETVAGNVGGVTADAPKPLLPQLSERLRLLDTQKEEYLLDVIQKLERCQTSEEAGEPERGTNGAHVERTWQNGGREAELPGGWVASEKEPPWGSAGVLGSGAGASGFSTGPAHDATRKSANQREKDTWQFSSPGDSRTPTVAHVQSNSSASPLPDASNREAAQARTPEPSFLKGSPGSRRGSTGTGSGSKDPFLSHIPLQEEPSRTKFVMPFPRNGPVLGRDHPGAFQRDGAVIGRSHQGDEEGVGRSHPSNRRRSGNRSHFLNVITTDTPSPTSSPESVFGVTSADALAKGRRSKVGTVAGLETDSKKERVTDSLVEAGVLLEGESTGRLGTGAGRGRRSALGGTGPREQLPGTPEVQPGTGGERRRRSVERYAVEGASSPGCSDNLDSGLVDKAETNLLSGGATDRLQSHVDAQPRVRGRPRPETDSGDVSPEAGRRKGRDRGGVSVLEQSLDSLAFFRHSHAGRLHIPFEPLGAQDVNTPLALDRGNPECETVRSSLTGRQEKSPTQRDLLRDEADRLVEAVPGRLNGIPFATRHGENNGNRELILGPEKEAAAPDQVDTLSTFFKAAALAPPKEFKKSSDASTDVPAPFPTSFTIPCEPRGSHLTVHILENWGDPFYVGLSGVELFDSAGKLLSFLSVQKQLRAKPADINVLSGYGSDPRTVDKLLDGVNWTCDDLHHWLAPFTPGEIVSINVSFDDVTTLGMIRLWNYNHSRIHSFRGARTVEVRLDDRVIFAGEVRKAPGIMESALRSAECLLFTEREDTLTALEAYDLIRYSDTANALKAAAADVGSVVESLDLSAC